MVQMLLLMTVLLFRSSWQKVMFLPTAETFLHPLRYSTKWNCCLPG